MQRNSLNGAYHDDRKYNAVNDGIELFSFEVSTLLKV